MKMKFVFQKFMLLGVVLPMIFAAGCNHAGTENKNPKKISSLAIMTWNVEALFDGVEDGTEYAEYRESADWNQEKYRGRLTVIAGAVGGMERKPDIIAVQEVESAVVVADLATAMGYQWTHFANIPGMALGVGVLSHYPISEAKSHSVSIDGDLAPRPMLEAHIRTGEADDESSLAIFVCHWKSKLGGDDITEKTRRASARIILRRIKELTAAAPDLPVLIMGDLNENHNEFYRRGGTVISALLPDDPRAAEFTGLYDLDETHAAVIGELQKDFIIISKNKPPVSNYFPDGVLTLYSPWNAELEDGSYYYRNEWETIDHFLLSPQLFTGTGWIFENCEVVNSPPFTNAKGLPAGYNPRTGSGLSDHLPLLLFLKMQEL